MAKNHSFLRITKVHLSGISPNAVTCIGNTKLLNFNPTALFCSVKCPGELILKTYDLVSEYRKIGVAVISGFHSPMEKECLNILLRGTQPIFLCPARDISSMRIRPEWKQALEGGNMLILSPFPENTIRITTKTALERNRFVGSLAEQIFISYAVPGGRMERLCKEWLAVGKTVLTFDSQYNGNLLKLGVEVI
ncbi:MAG: DNA-binding protein [FCB group bacterium]|nr:DNA-binding protein [FCB group bacterium]